MASGSNNQDVSELFQKMGEKLGWFKHGDLDSALESISKSSKKKKPTKSRVKEKEPSGIRIENKPKPKLKKAKTVLKEKPHTKMPPTNTLRKIDFSGFLSSDSDTSFSTVAENFDSKSLQKDRFGEVFDKTVRKSISSVQTYNQRKVIQVCSDSDEEKKPREDTYISCIGESQLGISVSDSDCSSCDGRGRRTRDSNTYDESIMGGPVSVTSLTLDVDGIGEPFVESTRIHRRSSVTYKHLMMSSPEGEDGLHESSCITSQICTKPNKVTKWEAEVKYPKKGNIGEDLCAAVEKLNLKRGHNQVHTEKGGNPVHLDRGDDPVHKIGVMSDPDVIDDSIEESPEKDWRYTTAFESLDAVDLTEQDNTINTSGDSKSLDDYVEVTDVATQTGVDNVCTAGDDGDPCLEDGRQKSSSGRGLYADKTVISPTSPHVYNDETFVGRHDKGDELNNSQHGLRDNCSIGKTTGNSDEEAVYLSSTAINENLNTFVYDQSTLSNIASTSAAEHDVTEDGSLGNVYSQITVDITDALEANDDNMVETNVKSKGNVSTDSDCSEYEVVDVCTQTEGANVSSVDDDTDVIGDRVGPDSEHEAQNETDSLESNVSQLDDKEDMDKTSEDGDHLKGSELNEESEDNTERSDNDGLSKSVHHSHEISKVNSSLERKFEDAQSDIDDSTDISTANILSKHKQKASHCFDISSDSDISEDLDDVAKDQENGQHTNNVVDEPSVDLNQYVNDIKTRIGNESTDSSDDDDFKSVTNVRPGRNKGQVPAPELEDSKTWRESKVDDNDSSEDDNLDAFLQKLKQPEKKKSSTSSPRSMEDFIVEDDEMTSESDGEEFYLRENQQLEKTPLLERIKSYRRTPSHTSEESSDDVFSSKIYPSSVTKHKQKNKHGTNRGAKSSSLFWVSSDSEDDSSEKVHKIKGRNLKQKNTNIDFSRSMSSDSISENNSPEMKERRNRRDRKQTDTKKNARKESHSFSDEDLPENNSSKHSPEPNNTNSRTSVMSSFSDSDSESPLFKTPNPLRRVNRPLSELTKPNNETSNVFKTPTVRPRSSFKDYISLSDDDGTSDDDSLPTLSTTNKENIPDYQTPVKPKTSDIFSKVPTPLSKIKTPRGSNSVVRKGSNYCSFLASLSTTVEDHRRDPDAMKYVKNFKRMREELTKHLFDLYNTTVFDKKLPADLPIIWNKRLLKTAGYCAYRCNRTHKDDRTARIELSTKVCDSAERVRDTLIHELCHAAVWLLNGVNGGHGNFWKYWARQASKMHHELPSISRCHSYSIATKFTYRCTRCGYSVGRHSKSLDTSRKVCGYCQGTFELIQNATPSTPQSASGTSVGSTPRTPNRFAMFVKENYNVVKQKNKDLKHGELMKELSREFAASKLNS